MVFKKKSFIQMAEVMPVDSGTKSIVVGVEGAVRRRPGVFVLAGLATLF
ncbi:MAG: hypothetical protein U0936_24915 [Planctomycetaceae bacterium]